MAALIDTVRIPVAALSPVRPILGINEDLLSVLLAADEAVADQLIALLTEQVQRQAASLSNTQISAVIRFIARFDERREALASADNPARQAGIERAAKTFASRG